MCFWGIIKATMNKEELLSLATKLARERLNSDCWRIGIGMEDWGGRGSMDFVVVLETWPSKAAMRGFDPTRRQFQSLPCSVDEEMAERILGGPNRLFERRKPWNGRVRVEGRDSNLLSVRYANDE